MFNNSSSLRLKAQSLPVEDCDVTKTYYRNVAWKELRPLKAAFIIRHENRRAKRHAHFLEVVC